ncbi:DUF2487 family protein [Paenibacillus sp. P46E]|uniref:DUF2487 family protein n=1 Tax=Paenibacillus sp. P46E TaxID=1349436 RepID=UPI00093D3295|nr:DUF2487 family protein [Paenibacillus sp. P46E]OKP93607.1 hypothetical protein A3849_31020 [Paenibacillus sp. P46E]
MKFSDFTVDSWSENRRFFDTCLIPFTGLRGTESPPEVAEALERLRNFLDLAEKPFQGRVVTYPALQYTGAESLAYINEICRKVKSSGFQHAIVLSADIPLTAAEIYESDLVLSLPDIRASQSEASGSYVRDEIAAMWLK